jgi:hypothetical protein
MSPSRTILYPIELEIKDTTDTDSSASYLDLHLEIKDTTDTDRSASYLDLNLQIKDTTDTDRSASYLDKDKMMKYIATSTYLEMENCKIPH